MSEQSGKTFEEIEIPVPWGHISGKWWGPRDKDPVIALHGWQDNAGTFDNLALLLADSVALLCIDLPGHGFSSHYPQGQFYYLWWDNLLVLRRVVVYLGVERVSLLGHSMGGAIGFLYAATYPEEVEKLISIDIASPRVEKTSIVVSQTPVCIERFIMYDNKLAKKVAPPCYNWDTMLEIVEDAHKGSVSRRNCEVLMRRGMKPSPTEPNSFYFTRDPRLKIAALASFSKDHVLSYAEKIRCAYLNIRGNSGLKHPYPELYNEVLDIIKRNSSRFEAHTIDGTHHLHLEDAQAVANIINPFLTTENSHSISQNHDGLVI